MNKSLVALAAGSVFILSATPALAQFYVGAGVGDSSKTSDATGKLLGGYKFNQNWGVEGAYTDLGHISGTNANVHSFSIAGTGTLPLSQGWSIQGKVGVAANYLRNVDGSEHTDALLGVGVNYDFTPKLGVGLEYENFGKFAHFNSSNVSYDSSIDNWSLNLKYRF